MRRTSNSCFYSFFSLLLLKNKCSNASKTLAKNRGSQILYFKVWKNMKHSGFLSPDFNLIMRGSDNLNVKHL